MKETRNILGWLGQAGEYEVLREFEKHVEEIGQTVACLAAAVKAYLSGDLNAKTIAIENTKDSEHRADRICQTIIRQLSEGLVLPPSREDLMRVTKNLDKVADVTNAAARLLGFIEERMPDSVLKNLSLSTELIVGSVAHLREAIRAMSSNDMARALQECEEIDRIEHEADEQKRAFIESIVRARLDATGVVLSFKLAETLEGVTDRVENVSDLIKLLVVKSR